MLAVMIRNGAAMSALVFSIPYLFICFFEKKSKLYYTLLFCGLCALMYFFLGKTNEIYYAKNNTWAEYYQYNDARRKIHTVNAIDNINDKDLEKINWTPLELDLFKSWYFLDLDVFSQKKISDLADIIETEKTIENYTKNIYSFIKERLTYLILSILFMLPLILFHRFRFIMLAIFLSEIFILSWYDGIVRMPDRIFIPMLFVIFVNQLFCMDKSFFIWNTRIKTD
jgi:hypothetical protein